MKHFVDVYEPISGRWFSWYLEDLDKLVEELNFQLKRSNLTYNWLADYLQIPRVAMGSLPIQHNHVELEINGVEQHGHGRYVLVFSNVRDSG